MPCRHHHQEGRTQKPFEGKRPGTGNQQAENYRDPAACPGPWPPTTMQPSLWGSMVEPETAQFCSRQLLEGAQDQEQRVPGGWQLNAERRARTRRRGGVRLLKGEEGHTRWEEQQNTAQRTEGAV